jgi:formate dehydrogenase maturation protein FdhE
MSDVTGLRPGSILGEAVKPPFAVLPDPAALFINRSTRLAAQAPTHDLVLFLSFLAKPTAKAEPCEKCRSDVKVLDQVDDHALNPFADDMATFGRDMLMAHAGWQRRDQNPFLSAY